MPSEVGARTWSVVLGVLALGLGTPASAQVPDGAAPPSPIMATRAELAAIVAHPPRGMSSADLQAAQRRLTQGDFAVGDRILIVVPGDTVYSDTFTVRTGNTLQLPYLPPLVLSGVLRSESDSVVSAFLGKYVRSPEVVVTPLLRLGIFGGVRSPGYYDLPPETLLSGLVMTAGGLSEVGDMRRTKINRGNEEVMDSKAVSQAIQAGMTIDIANLQSGDNVNVGVANPSATLNKVQIITALLAIPLMIVTISSLSD